MSNSSRGVTLCVGEALIALTPVGSSLRTAGQVVLSAAGAELNVAVHLARLGVPARFAGRVGDDPFGLRVRDVLVGEGVDARYLVLDPELPTGIYAKDPGAEGTSVHYYRAGSAATRLAELPPGALTSVGHLHLTGITPALSDSCAALVRRLVDARACPVSFDVNHRPALWTAEQAATPLLDLARRADTVFVGLDEALRLWGTGTAQEVRALLPDVPELVVKDGGLEAVAWSPAGATRVAALPVDVVEPVGAGDAFAAGYLAARQSGRGLGQALRQGHVLAAAVLTTVSDHGGLPDEDLLAAARSGADWPAPGRSLP